MASGRAFHWGEAFSENECRKGTVSSLVKDILLDFIDSPGQKLIKWSGRRCDRPFKILNNKYALENNFKFDTCINTVTWIRNISNF